MPRATTVGIETLLVLAVGLGFAVVANALSPRGLQFGRNYFPTSDLSPVAGSSGRISATAAKAGSTANPPDPRRQRLEQRNLKLIAREEMVDLFRDPRYQQGTVVFVDARNDEHYAAGHIPGAWQFDPYHAEKNLPAILPVCLVATHVVVYCSGGECEDSEYAAVMLRDIGIPRDSLFVYPGGITEWALHELPVETGKRHSGQFLKPKP